MAPAGAGAGATAEWMWADAGLFPGWLALARVSSVHLAAERLLPRYIACLVGLVLTSCSRRTATVHSLVGTGSIQRAVGTEASTTLSQPGSLARLGVA